MTIRDRFFSTALPSWLFTLGSLLYHEWLLLAWTGQGVTLSRFAVVTAFALGFGLLLGLFISMLPAAVSKWAAVGCSLVMTALFLTEYFLTDAYQTFMTPVTILHGAGGIAADYRALVLSLLMEELWRLGLLLLPALGYGLLCCNPDIDWKFWGALTAGSLGGFLLAAALVFGLTRDRDKLSGNRDFDTAVRSFGLSTALTLEAFQTDEVLLSAPSPSEPAAEEGTAGLPAPRYGYNELPELNFSAMANTEYNDAVAALHRYIDGQLPSTKNAYTGLFAGKNLIFITAEAFSAQVIDPELTPTLYRLATQGIQFTDYYQPAWGASTTSGEFSNLVGLVPTNGGGCMREPLEQTLFLTLGQQFQKLGYHTAAYHNHTASFYDRNQTHPALGYDQFLAQHGGLEGITPVWPESDREMMDITVSQYLDQQPFHVYYMTVSGHCGYLLEANAQSAKNYSQVAHLDLPEVLKGYLAAQLELEKAMASLVSQLEEAGIAQDTVIVLATDHYPYGLEKSSTWGNQEDYLSQWYGQEVTDVAIRDRSALIIWSGCLEGQEIVVDTPVYSLDILPTLSNLFGLRYDSRLLVGRDVFSDADPLVLWPDHSWKTDRGFFNAQTGVFTPAEGDNVPSRYIQSIHQTVRDNISYSSSVLQLEYFNYLRDWVE